MAKHERLVILERKRDNSNFGFQRKTLASIITYGTTVRQIQIGTVKEIYKK